jgi:hypothetical protein
MDTSVPAADRADVGRNDNQAPDFAKIETERLVGEYKGLTDTLEKLEAEVGRVPKPEDDTTALRIGGLIKRFRDLYARFENTRVVEIEPHLRRQNAINSFFNGHKKRIQPAEKSERRTSPGLIDFLQGLIDAYQADKEAKERERLAREAAETERLAREAQKRAEEAKAEEDRLAREAAEREAEATRARAPAQIEKKTEIAKEASKEVGVATGAAIGAQVQAQSASDKAQEARIATLAKGSDIVRTRGVTDEGAGVLLTTGKESFAFVVDRTKLDPKKLFPYFNEKEVDKAVRAWAKATNHNEPMDGAEIGWKSKGITR